MEEKVPRQRREFTAEYKADVVALCRKGEKSIGAIARDLDIRDTVIRRWVAQYEIDAGQREGLTTEERAELTHLRRENRILREERDILKRATAFFARETR
jgi:transposase